MKKKTIIIIVSVIAAAAVAAGLGVLIWWLVSEDDPVIIEEEEDPYRVIELQGAGIGNTSYSAAFTRIREVGDIFWWFYPTTAAAAATRPLLLWLDGVTGIPPSLLANLGMVGPYDFNLNVREESWIDEFNLLFVDAPVGTGFSVPASGASIPQTLDEQADHLLTTLNTFYMTHAAYVDAPLYIIGQGSGAQIALQLAIRLQNADFSHNLNGVVLANGLVSPALALSKLGFYLEEMGYIDYVGRAAVEAFSLWLNTLVNQRRYVEAFNYFITLDDYVNTHAETVAVNLGNIVEKLTRTNNSRSSKVPDYFGQREYVRNLFNLDSQEQLFSFMDETVAEALGVNHNVEYDHGRLQAVQASRETLMIPSVDKVEYILQNTNLSVSIYNGNLDAVSNTPGQLEWVNNLQWSGQEQFRSSPRQTLVVNRLIEGYFRVTDRLRFYWMNAAGQLVPRDSPAGSRRVMQLITGS